MQKKDCCQLELLDHFGDEVRVFLADDSTNISLLNKKESFFTPCTYKISKYPHVAHHTVSLMTLCAHLKKPEHLKAVHEACKILYPKKMDNNDYKEAFQHAVETGDVLCTKIIYDWAAPALQHKMLTDNDFHSWLITPDDGNALRAQMYEWLKPSIRGAMIAAVWTQVSVNRSDFLDQLYEWATPALQERLKTMSPSKRFLDAVCAGNVELARRYYHWAAEDKKSTLLQCGNFAPFQFASSAEVLSQLLAWANERQKASFQHYHLPAAFFDAVKEGRTVLAHRLKTIANQESWSRVIGSKEYRVAFEHASKAGSIELIQSLYKWAHLKKRKKLLSRHAMWNAAIEHRLDIMQILYGYMSDYAAKRNISTQAFFKPMGNLTYFVGKAYGEAIEKLFVWKYPNFQKKEQPMGLFKCFESACTLMKHSTITENQALETLQCLYRLARPAQQMTLLSFRHYSPFKHAAKSGRLLLIKQLYAWAKHIFDEPALFETSIHTFSAAPHDSRIQAFVYKQLSKAQREALLERCQWDCMNIARHMPSESNGESAIDLRDYPALWLFATPTIRRFANTHDYKDNALKKHPQFNGDALQYNPSTLTSIAHVTDRELAEIIFSEASKAQRRELIAANNYLAAREACRQGDLAFLKKLYCEWAEPDQQAAMLEASNYGAFVVACAVGNLEIMQQIHEWVSMNNRQTMIRAEHYQAFWAATNSNRLQVFQALYDWCDVSERADMISALGYRVFRIIMRDEKVMPPQCMRAYQFEKYIIPSELGAVQILRQLFVWLDVEQRQALIQDCDYALFRKLANSGHLKLLRVLYQNATPYDQDRMIRANHYEAFRVGDMGLDYRHKLNRGIKKQIYLWANPQHRNTLKNLIISNNFRLFRQFMQVYRHCMTVEAYDNTLAWLFSIPEIYKWAAPHEEYEVEVKQFTSDYLHELKLRQLSHEDAFPNSVFDLEAEERKVCFYIIKHLIHVRPSNEEGPNHQLNWISFLISIPSVQALLARPNQGHQHFYHQASRIGNYRAASLLVGFSPSRDQIDRAAARNQAHLGDEQIGNIDHVVDDVESSMSALSVTERSALVSLYKEYKSSMKDQGGVEPVFQALKKDLKDRYNKSPAYLKSGVLEHPLPLKWPFDNKSQFSEREAKQAKQAYYRHTVHTAYRYLSKPNRWLAPNAAYLGGQRCANFDKYKPLIATLYLAAKDVNSETTHGGDVNDRTLLFFRALAYIGRAHNWDKSRPRYDDKGKMLHDATGEIITEQYDDMKGDKPSCYSGVNRRLFQSLLGHPKFTPLTMVMIRQELRDFIRTHFHSVIHAQNQARVKEHVEECIVEGTDSGYLREFNLSEQSIATFLSRLADKYGTAFKKSREFADYIHHKLRSGERDSHIVHFWTFANLEDCIQSKLGDEDNGDTNSDNDIESFQFSIPCSLENSRDMKAVDEDSIDADDMKVSRDMQGCK